MTRRPFFLLPFVLLAVSTGPTASAQMRATIGLGAWTLSGETRTESSFSSITRLTAGAGYTWPLRSGFSVRGEVIYLVRGASGRTVVGDLPVIATFDLGYFDVPILLVWALDRSSGPRPSVFVGPSFSYRMQSWVSFRAEDGGPEFRQRDDSVRRTGFGLVVGAEAAFGFSDVEWFLGLRYGRGLTNARQAEPALVHSGVTGYLGVTF